MYLVKVLAELERGAAHSTANVQRAMTLDRWHMGDALLHRARQECECILRRTSVRHHLSGIAYVKQQQQHIDTNT